MFGLHKDHLRSIDTLEDGKMDEPDWDAEFQLLQGRHGRIGVFYMGHSARKEGLRERCKSFSGDDTDFIWQGNPT